jgi:hypothetical protein
MHTLSFSNKPSLTHLTSNIFWKTIAQIITIRSYKPVSEHQEQLRQQCVARVS